MSADEKWHTPLPCPFCGVQPLLTRAREAIFTIHCGNEECNVRCEVATPSPETAVISWNTRAALSETQL
jgi:transcription elongation factor Elf1